MGRFDTMKFFSRDGIFPLFSSSPRISIRGGGWKIGKERRLGSPQDTHHFLSVCIYVCSPCWEGSLTCELRSAQKTFPPSLIENGGYHAHMKRNRVCDWMFGWREGLVLKNGSFFLFAGPQRSDQRWRLGREGSDEGDFGRVATSAGFGGLSSATRFSHQSQFVVSCGGCGFEDAAVAAAAACGLHAAQSAKAAVTAAHADVAEQQSGAAAEFRRVAAKLELWGAV